MSGQIALDPEAGYSTVDRLGGVETTVEGQRGAVLRLPAGFPPGLAATTVAEQVSIMAGLEAGRGATVGIRADLAQRTMMFVLAGGGTLSRGRMAQLLHVVARSHLLDVGRGLMRAKSTWGHALDITKTGIRVIAEVGRKLDHARGFTSKSFDRWLISNKSPSHRLFRMFNKVEKLPGVRLLNAANTVSSYVDAYKKSSARTVVGRLTSTVVGGSLDAVFGENPVTGAADFVLGGVVDGSIDAVTVVGEEGYYAAFDRQKMGSSAEQFNEDARAGKHGWWVQAWNGAGEAMDSALFSMADGDDSAVEDWSDRARNGEEGPVMKGFQWTGDRLGSGLYDAYGHIFH